MKSYGFKSWDRALLGGASLVAIAAAALISAPAHAQDQAAEEDVSATEEVVVTGVRQSLKSAQQIKRDADTVVDSITATDIGAFPDKSVAEALQRVAGITVNRFAASDDTAHFSAEPSGVIVRGLQQVRSEFNGRDSFSANSGRGLSWGDVSPELMAGVDTYKNQTAELIEGGIAGTINLRTRVPFDAAGELIAISSNVNYGSLSEEFTPEVSGIYSNRWDTEIGEFGVMLNAAYSDVQTASQGIQYGRMAGFTNGFGTGTQWIPTGISFRDNVYDRTRNGFAVAGQWQDNEKRFLVTTQYNRSNYKNEWHEYVVSTTLADVYGQPPAYRITNPSNTQPAPGSAPFTFDSRGLFQTGLVTADIGWWGADNAESRGFAQNSSGQQFVNACYGWNGCEPARRGNEIGTATRYNTNENMTEDLSLNVKWRLTDRIRLNFDVQRVNSTVENYDMDVSLASYANSRVDLTGEHPRVVLENPLNVNFDPGAFANPSNWYIRSMMDHIEDSEGEELAYRADVEFDIGTTWLDSLKVGARRADRDQTVRWSNYNWQNVANQWSQNAAWFNTTRGPDAASGFNGYPSGITEARYFGPNLFDGDNIGPNWFTFFDMELIEDKNRLRQTMSATALGLTGGVGWDPICSNTGDRAQEVPGTCYTPWEVADVSEQSDAAYAMLRFGGPDARIGEIGVSGNIGVRWVKTLVESEGSLAFPEPFNAQTLLCEPRPITDPTAPVVPNRIPNTIGCYISPQDIAFASGAGVPSTAENEVTNWLPSFNLKLDLTDEWVVRFAASRAMARPEIGYLKNYTRLSAGLPQVDNPNDPRWIRNSAGEVTGVNVDYTAQAYNPYLEPTTADQFDLALEYYFDDVGSLTFTAFYKKFNNYIQYGSYFIDVTNAGVTREVEVRGPISGDGAKIQGFEVAYQSFFDFLPAPFDGFGVQANYTYVDNQGITNSNSRIVSGDGTSGTTNAGNPELLNTGKLEGLSEHSYNLVGMYEKGPWALRAAYNWRSEYLVTNFDCCVYLPVWSDEIGYLDASVRYRVNDNVELSVQGSNLLDTETVLYQQVTDVTAGRQLLPNGWFRNDRRFVFGLRLKF